MYSKSLQITLFITLFFIVNCFGQTVSSSNAEGEKWTRIETAEQELSLAFPPNYIVDTEKKQSRSIYKINGFSNDVTMELSVSKSLTSDEQKFMMPPDGMQTQSFTKKNLKGMRSFNNSADTYLNENIRIFGEKNYYYISVSASNKNKPELERFLYSIKIRGENLFKNPNAPNYPENLIAIKSLTSSPEVIEAFERKLEKKKFKAEKIISTEADQTISYADYSRAPIVVEQPYPEFRPNFSNMGSSGFSYAAKLKLTLLANGQIGDIKVVSGSNESFTESCVDAARKLRFVPGQKNGINADSVKIINYNIRALKFTTTTILPGGAITPGMPY